MPPARYALALAALVPLCATNPSRAHDDILVAVQNGRLVTGTAADLGADPRPGDRAFLSRLHGRPPAATDPGFLAPAAGLPDGFSSLPPNLALRFDLLAYPLPGLERPANLAHWPGDTPVAFSFPPPATHATVSLFNLAADVSGQASNSPGFHFANTTTTGALHQHLSFELRSETAADPDPGLYLLTVRLAADGLRDSAPFWLLMNHGLSEDEAATALAWVERTLVPEPATATLLLWTATLCTFHRRKEVSRPRL